VSRLSAATVPSLVRFAVKSGTVTTAGMVKDLHSFNKRPPSHPLPSTIISARTWQQKCCPPRCGALSPPLRKARCSAHCRPLSQEQLRLRCLVPLAVTNDDARPQNHLAPTMARRAFQMANLSLHRPLHHVPQTQSPTARSENERTKMALRDRRPLLENCQLFLVRSICHKKVSLPKRASSTL
jgi:hypothetical protein